MLMLSGLKKELKAKASPKKAKILQRFFKTGPGEYGYGDVFLGVVVPETRKVAKKYSTLKVADAVKLLHSKIHEERLAALLIMVDKFQAPEQQRSRKRISSSFLPSLPSKARWGKKKVYFLRPGNEQEIIYKTYLKNTKYINNWDLVDLSAEKIVGDYLFDKPKDILYKLAESKSVWERRIAIIATFNFIKNNKFEETFKISKILLNDEHDLIHKAVGWMLREVGKRDIKTEKDFLDKYSKKMARTTFRYAIERFPGKNMLIKKKKMKARLKK